MKWEKVVSLAREMMEESIDGVSDEVRYQLAGFRKGRDLIKVPRFVPKLNREMPRYELAYPPIDGDWVEDFTIRGAIRLSSIPTFDDWFFDTLVLMPCFGILVPHTNAIKYAEDHTLWSIVPIANLHEKTRCKACNKVNRLIIEMERKGLM